MKNIYLKFFPIISYFSIATLIHLLITYEWTMSGDVYAEMATNYYFYSNSGFSFLKQIFATDHGYISPIMRIGPYLASIFSLTAQEYLYLFAFQSFITVVILPSILILNKFHLIHHDEFIRALGALLISASFNFESRIYINISYIFIALVFIYLINFFRGGLFNRFEMILICLISISKPLIIAIIPMIILGITQAKKQKLFLFILIILFLIYFIQIQTGLLSSKSKIDIIEIIVNAGLLAFYNIGKVLIFYASSISIKIFNLDNIYYIFLTSLIGFIFTILIFKIVKNSVDKYLIFTVLVINLIWAFFITYGIGSSTPLIGKINSDFNRYDLISVLNLITAIAISKNYWMNYSVRLVLKVFLILTILIYSSASIYYFYNNIKNNILYIGTSTWLLMKDNPKYNGCTFLSPLGWGFNCKVEVNVINRKFTPTLNNFNEKLSIIPPYNGKIGYIAFFTNKNSTLNNLKIYDSNNKMVEGEIFNLSFNRIVAIYKADCFTMNSPMCELNIHLNNVTLYTSTLSGNKPLIAFLH